MIIHVVVYALYLHLPNIFPIKYVGGPSAFMRAWLHHYVNQHSTTYIVLLSAYEVEVVDVNGLNAFPYVHFKRKWHVDCKEVRCCCIYDNQTLKISIFCSYFLHWITPRLCSVRHPSACWLFLLSHFCTFEIWEIWHFCVKVSNIATNFIVKRCKYKYWIAFCWCSRAIWIASDWIANFHAPLIKNIDISNHCACCRR